MEIELLDNELQQLLDSYENQILFLEEFFKDYTNYEEKDLEVYLEKLSQYTKKLGIPFALLFNKFAEKLAELFFEYPNLNYLMLALIKTIIDNFHFETIKLNSSIHKINSMVETTLNQKIEADSQRTLTKFEKLYITIRNMEIEAEIIIEKLNYINPDENDEYDIQLLRSRLNQLVNNDLSEVNDEFQEYIYGYLNNVKEKFINYDLLIGKKFDSR